MIANEIQRIEEAHPELKGKVTEADAIDELVARSCEDMLTNSKATQEWANKLEPKAKKKLVDHIKAMFKSIREFFDDLIKQYKSTSKEAQIIRQNKEAFEQLSKKWDEALTEAVKVSPAVDAELERIRRLAALGGFIPCPDHRLMPGTKFELVQYYAEEIKKIRI